MRPPHVERSRLRVGLVARRTAFGAALGASLAAATALLGLACGVFHTHHSPNAAFEMTVVVSLPLAALIEELVFRRLLLEWTTRLIGRWPALLLGSALFAALHARNPGFGVAGAIGVFLAGLWLGQLYLQSRRVVAGTAAHLAWNVGISVVLGLPVSGIHLGGLLHFGPTRDGFFSGGEFGPEASPVAWAVFAAAVVALEIHHRRRVHAQ
ncbi:MAG: CPBP family intramembrane metalloprotease [Myxococcota bacterium]|jgi:hypothetical protein|nr:CPBP family intramembrane metalloprotease [Myxococcota bacterium]